MTNLFEIASRKKYRFSYKGWISSEDLWDLTLDELNASYKWLLNLKNKFSSEESLISKETDSEEYKDILNKLDIVKHVFNVKKQELEDAKRKAENAEKKKKILDIIAKKQDDSLMNSSEEDLVKMLDELDN